MIEYREVLGENNICYHCEEDCRTTNTKNNNTRT